MIDGALRITSLEAVTARFPLESALRVGHNLVSEREYTFLSLFSAEGAVGEAYGLTRGLPIVSILTRFLAPMVLGADISDPRSLHRERSRRLRPIDLDSCLRRAESLIDIATWDLLGKTTKQPVYKLLGADQRTGLARGINVIGYAQDGESEKSTFDRMERYMSERRDLIKIAGHSDFGALGRLARFLSGEAGGDPNIALDMAWTLYGPELITALRTHVDDSLIYWLEDPVHAEDSNDLESIRSGWTGKIAVGDEVSCITPVFDAVNRGLADIARIDSTTVGGLTGAVAACRSPYLKNVPVSPHIYPEMHSHLAAACANVKFVEFFPEDGSLDASNQFMREREFSPLRPGATPSADGLGLELDWDSIRRHSVASYRLEEES
jgi:L-alanine-DL-glutamate epimerase-like enolase superfamily enzyme